MSDHEPFRSLANADDVLPFLRGKPRLTGWVESVLGLAQLNRILGGACEEAGTDPLIFADASLRLAGITVKSSLSIPETGSTVVVANHPFGGADAIALFGECLRVRSDVRIFGNRMLEAIPPLRAPMLSLDIMDEDASHGNGIAIRQALRHLRKGGLVIVFPAGMVAHFQPRSCSVVDAPWNPMVGALIRMGRSRVVPAAFKGRNSFWFQALGMISPTVRTAMLPREMVRLKGKTIRLVGGAPLEDEAFHGLEDAETARKLEEIVSEMWKSK